MTQRVEFLEVLSWWEEFPTAKLREKREETYGPDTDVQPRRSAEASVKIMKHGNSDGWPFATE